MKFTFKTTKPTGKYRSFQNSQHDIKLNGGVCGSIQDDKPHTVKFMKIKDDILEDGNKNCVWMWIRIKKEFSSVKEAKSWVIENSEQLQKQINLFILK